MLCYHYLFLFYQQKDLFIGQLLFIILYSSIPNHLYNLNANMKEPVYVTTQSYKLYAIISKCFTIFFLFFAKHNKIIMNEVL